MGHDIKLTASDNFQLGGYRADPATAPKGGGGGDPGNLRRQSPHSRGLRSAGERGLCRHRACDLRPRRAQFPVRLFAGRDRDGAQIRRQSRLGGDAARHPGRHRCRQECRSGRHHRFLPWRQHRLCGRDKAVRSVRGDRLLRRRHRSLRRRQAESADPTAFRREGRRHSARAMSRPSAPSGPMSRSMSIPARSTAFTATNGQATTRPVRISPGRAAWVSSPSI